MRGHASLKLSHGDETTLSINLNAIERLQRCRAVLLEDSVYCVFFGCCQIVLSDCLAMCLENPDEMLHVQAHNERL